jgi:hypothetical protein
MDSQQMGTVLISNRIDFRQCLRKIPLLWKRYRASLLWAMLGGLCVIAITNPAVAHEGVTKEIRQVFGKAVIAYYYDSTNKVLFAEDLQVTPRVVQPASAAPHLPTQSDMPPCPPASQRRVNAIEKGAVLAAYYSYNHEAGQLEFLVAENLSNVRDRIVTIKCGRGETHCTALHQCMSCGGLCCCQ